MITICWAPTETFASKREMLGCIADSYQRTTGLALVKLHGSVFRNDGAPGMADRRGRPEWDQFPQSRGRCGGHGRLWRLRRRSSADDPSAAFRCADHALALPAKIGAVSITLDDKSLAVAVDAPDFTDSLGRPWKARAEEFEADAGGRPEIKGARRADRHGHVRAARHRIVRLDLCQRNPAVPGPKAGSNSAADGHRSGQFENHQGQRVDHPGEFFPGTILTHSSTIMGHWAYATARTRCVRRDAGKPSWATKRIIRPG